MNGRVYDPNLGRFLSVDPVFQFPTNTQSLNPYSYVLNNPLSLTDPTGYTSCDAPEGGGTTDCQQKPQDGYKTGDKVHVSNTATGSHIASSATATKQADGTWKLDQGGPSVALGTSGTAGNGSAPGKNDTNPHGTATTDLNGPKLTGTTNPAPAQSGGSGSLSALADAGSESGKPLTAEQRQQTEAAAEADLKSKGLMGDHKVDYKNDYASVRTNKDGSVDKTSLQFFRTKTDADRDAAIHADTNGAPIEGLTAKGSMTSMVFAGAVAPGSVMNSHGVAVPMDAQMHTEFVIMHEFAHGNGIVDEHAADVDAMQKLGLW